MFNRMSIGGCWGYWSGPLMVYLVNVLIQKAVVKEAVPVVEPDVVADDADKDITECGV